MPVIFVIMNTGPAYVGNRRLLKAGIGEKMEIYYADIGMLAAEEVFLEKLKELPKARRERLTQYKNDADRKRGLLAGLLLEYGLNKRGYTLTPERKRRYPAVTLAVTKEGKPCIREVPELWFNLSHSGNYAAAVFDQSAVGIDMEQLQRADAGRKIAHRFFMWEESEYLSDIKDEQAAEYAFARLWTRKESYLKAIGLGLRLSMNTFSVLGEKVVQSGGTAGEEGYFLKTWELPERYCISVCAREKITAEPRRLNWDVLSGELETFEIVGV